jgi:Protein of unknown function (DUF3168)/Head domain of trimeric autotransporter adhesin
MASPQETLFETLKADEALVALVEDRFHVGEIPDLEDPTPWVFYYVPSSVPYDDLGNEETDVDQVVEFVAFADTYAEAKAINDAIKTALDGFSGGQVKRAFWKESTEEILEDGYRHASRFSVMGSEASVGPAAGGSARISTGFSTITLTAGGNSLTLSTDGLFLYPDGQPIGIPIDLSQYARLDQSNSFVGDQFISGALEVGSLQSFGSISGDEVSASTTVSAPVIGATLSLSSSGPASITNNAGLASDAVLTVQGKASQTGLLQRWRDSAGAVLASFSSDCKLLTMPINFAIGNGASAVGSQSLAFGLNASASGANSIAIGPLAAASQNGAVAVGVSASATAASGIAIGNTATCNQASSAAIGSGVTLAANEMSFGCVNGLGAVAGTRLTGHSSTQPRSMAQTLCTWVNSTDAARLVRVRHLVNDFNNPITGLEYLRAETNGTAAMIGFFGAAAVARPTITGSRGGNAALASLLTALASLGLVTDSTTA